MAELLHRAVRTALFFMSASLIAWAVVPEGRATAAGLALGAAASVVNGILLARRVESLARSAAEQGARRFGTGFAVRLATVLAVVLIQRRFPEYVSLPAALGACFIVPIAVFFAAIAQNKHRSDGKG